MMGWYSLLVLDVTSCVAIVLVLILRKYKCQIMTTQFDWISLFFIIIFCKFSINTFFTVFFVSIFENLSWMLFLLQNKSSMYFFLHSLNLRVKWNLFSSEVFLTENLCRTKFGNNIKALIAIPSSVNYVY